MNSLAMAALIEAATEPTKQAAGNPNYTMLVIFGVLIVAMVVMQRRAKKKAGDANAFRTELAPGQRVMTASGMIGMISRVDGDIITVMSASGSESAWVRRAIGKLVTDDEWEAMTAEYPDVPDATPATDEAPSAIEENTPTTDTPEKDS